MDAGFQSAVRATLGRVSLDDGLLQQVQGLVEPFTAVPAAFLVVEQHGLGQLLADAHDGVQGAQGILKHHGQLMTAKGMELLLGNFEQILAVVDDLAAVHHGVSGQNAHDGAGSDGLARAAFAGDGQGFALVQVEGNVAHRAHRAVICAERDRQVFDFQLSHISLPLLSKKDSARRAGRYRTG